MPTEEQADWSFVDGAFEEVLLIDDAVCFIKEKDFKHFPLPVSH